MGSGSSSIYAGTGGGSQPFAESYHVVGAMIVSVNSSSGHYRPNIESMNKVNDALQRLYESNPNLFAPGSNWRNN